MGKKEEEFDRERQREIIRFIQKWLREKQHWQFITLHLH